MSKTKKLLAALLACSILIALAASLSACKKEPEEEKNTSSEETSTEAEPMPYPLSINQTEIKASPEKVVCLSPAVTEIIYEMGYGDTIIGRSSYCDYPENVLGAKDVGTPANRLQGYFHHGTGGDSNRNDTCPYLLRGIFLYLHCYGAYL